jgi:hypothetical protein
LREKAEGLLFESKEPFPVDLDLAWVWIGYAKKQNALEVLESTFDSGTDYLTLEREPDEQGVSGVLTPQQKGAREAAHKKNTPSIALVVQVIGGVFFK